MKKVPYQFPDPKQKYLTTAEAAEKLCLTADSVKVYCNSDPPRLNALKVGHSWLIPLQEIKRYLTETNEHGRPKKAHSA